LRDAAGDALTGATNTFSVSKYLAYFFCTSYRLISSAWLKRVANLASLSRMVDLSYQTSDSRV
jgi:hypothetical protein